MHPIIRTLNESKLFVMGFTVYLIGAALFCSSYSKGDCFIHLNGLHTSALDTFFTYYTMLGDGLAAVVLAVVLLAFRKYLLGFHILVVFLSSGLVARVIKELTHAPRPKTFFASGQYQYFIDGVTNSGWASFPSGHTTTAFAVATMLALHTNNRLLSLGYLLLAISVGYSRVYLGQHFPQDVLAGSIIGVFFAACVYVMLPQLKLFGRRIAREEAATNFAALELP